MLERNVIHFHNENPLSELCPYFYNGKKCKSI